MADRQRVAAGSRVDGHMKGDATDALRQAEAARRAAQSTKK